MSFTITVSGHVEGKEAEARVLAKAADFVEAIDARGSFSFTGNHLVVQAAPAQDAVAKAREAVAAVNPRLIDATKAEPDEDDGA